MSKERKSMKEAMKRDELGFALNKTIKFSRSIFTKHIKMVGIVTSIIIVVGLIITFYFVKKNSEDKKASEVFSQGMDEYKKEKYDNALVYLKDIPLKYK